MNKDQSNKKASLNQRYGFSVLSSFASGKLAIPFAIIVAFIGAYFILGSFADNTITPIPVGKPYIDAAQILPYPEVSFYHQVWRGWMETVPATKFLGGIGVNYNPGNITASQSDANLKYLASIGVHVIRISPGWDSINHLDETQFNPMAQARLTDLFANCKKYGITPTITLDANDQAPEPGQPRFFGNLVGNPQIGDSKVTVSGLNASDIVVHKPNSSMGSSGITGGGLVEAQHLITKVSPVANGNLTLSLSKPLTAALTGKISVQYLKYMPLYPVGTPEFNTTMAGWLTYTKTATDLVKAAGITKFNVEIWNELSFGSKFLNINSYYPYASRPYPNSEGDSTLVAGGNKWELANQTTQYIKKNFGNNVNVIWGFTNSCPTCGRSDSRPPNTAGESYHIYGTGLNNFTSPTAASSPPNSLLEGPYIPNVDRALPEGNLILGYHIVNPLKGKLQPANRNKLLPPGTSNLLHYMTEDGFSPGGGGHALPTKAQNELLKAKAFIRAYSFWLNKGLDQYDLYSAFSPIKHADNDGGYNLLASNSQKTGSPVTQQSQTLGNFTSQFSGAVNPTSPRNLGVNVSDITPNDNTSKYEVFPADPKTHEPALNYREMFQFLPFQVSNNKFVISTYLMSWNIYSTPPLMQFQVDINNVDGINAQVTYFDPILNKTVPITVVSASKNNIVLNLESVDYPRTISITERASTKTPTVNLSAPLNGSTLTGKTNLAASSTNASKLQFKVDGIDTGPSFSTSPATYTLDSTLLRNGRHTITAIASDTAGLTISSNAAVVNISNPDITPPSTPLTLRSPGINTNRVTLSWLASSDEPGGSGLGGYHVYRDGKLIATRDATSGANVSYVDSSLTPNTSYIYAVSAFDVAGNKSGLSLPITVVTHTIR